MTPRLDELDHYALLGVAPDAQADAIKAGFRNFARHFHPDRFAGDPERVAAATRVYRRATEAYRVLSNADRRRFYDEELRRAASGSTSDPPRPSFRPSGRPSSPDSVGPRARPFVARAEQALRAGDPKQARLNFQIALQHEPDSEALRRKLAEVDALLKLR
jgi:curved DNA-binding protein CbpA